MNSDIYSRLSYHNNDLQNIERLSFTKLILIRVFSLKCMHIAKYILEWNLNVCQHQQQMQYITYSIYVSNT